MKRRKASPIAVALGAWAVLVAVLLGGLVVGALELGRAHPTPAATPVTGVPAVYQADARASGTRFGIPWTVLAGIYRVECDFGTSPLPGCNPEGTENPFGAQGPGQFLPGTWRAGLGPHQLIPPGPPTTSVADGYATDGDGDGVADPWDPADAVASTARLLAANGGAVHMRQAVFAYNHSWSYVDQVMALAAGYRQAVDTAAADSTASTNTAPDTPAPPDAAAVAAVVLAFAAAALGTPYEWGGAGPASYDCWGLVMAAYARAGITLPHNAALQEMDTAAATVPLDHLAPGDLVFFGASDATIHHVGIYVGDGQMIDAPHTGAVVRVDSIDWPDLLTATDPASAAGSSPTT